MKLALHHFGKFLDELDKAQDNVDILAAVRNFKAIGRSIETEFLVAAKRLEELEECHCGKSMD